MADGTFHQRRSVPTRSSGHKQWQTNDYNFPHVKNTQVLMRNYKVFYSSLELEIGVAAWKTSRARSARKTPTIDQTVQTGV